MKLRGKMQLLIGALVAVMLIVVGVIAAQLNYSAILDTVENSLVTSTTLASNQISADMESYKTLAKVTGEDAVLASTSSNEEKGEIMDLYASEFGFTSGNILGTDGISYKDGTDFSDREYVKQALAGIVNISDITLSKLTGKYGFSVAAPLVGEGGSTVGVVYYRMDVDFIEAITSSIDISEHSYAYIVDGTGTVIVHPDSELITSLNIAEQGGALGAVGREVIDGKAGNATYTYNGQEVMCGYAPIGGTNGWGIVIAAPVADFTATIYRTVNKIIVVVAILTVISILLAGVYAAVMSKKVINVEETLVAIAKGDFSTELAESSGKDEIAILNNAAYSLQATLKGIIGETNKILSAMAAYDLTSKDMQSYPGEFDTLVLSVNHISSILKGLIAEVKESANCVGVGSKELADAAENLSQGTVAQANSIQTVAHDIENMAESIANSSENGNLVNKQLVALDAEIQTGNEEMTELLHAVKEVESMSNDIQKIVGTIDSIAFQTNILALNAAVEAASAGEHGKGFAVVADEIGNLANKCSDSSKQTEELVLKCIDRIKKAKECADSTFECLSGVVKNSNEISEAFTKINKDTAEQAVHSANVQREVNNISDFVQNNTAAAEETAAASETLSEQAMNLNGLITQFRL